MPEGIDSVPTDAQRIVQLGLLQRAEGLSTEQEQELADLLKNINAGPRREPPETSVTPIKGRRDIK